MRATVISGQTIAIWSRNHLPSLDPKSTSFLHFSNAVLVNYFQLLSDQISKRHGPEICNIPNYQYSCTIHMRKTAGTKRAPEFCLLVPVCWVWKVWPTKGWGGKRWRGRDALSVIVQGVVLRRAACSGWAWLFQHPSLLVSVLAERPDGVEVVWAQTPIQ